MFEKQTYEKKSLLIADADTELMGLSFDFVTVFSPQDYYGKNYLTDLALSTRFSSESVVGKAAYYSGDALMDCEKAYTYVQEPVELRRQMAAKACFKEGMKAGELAAFHPESRILALDEFNYCENAKECEKAEDIEVYTGVPLEEIYAYTDRIPPVTLHKSSPFSTEELYNEVTICDGEFVEKSLDAGGLRLVREADDDAIVWLRTKKNYKISDYSLGSRIGFFTEVSEKSGNVRCQIEYYDEEGRKLAFLNFALDGFTLLRISDRAKTFKLIFRMRGKASVTLKSMYASSPDSLLPAPFPMKEALLITEDYPDYASPDKLNELHRFVKENNLEVFKAGGLPSYLPYSEYDGVQIISAQYDAIREYLSVRHFSHIYVHSSSKEVVRRLSDYEGRVIHI